MGKKQAKHRTGRLRKFFSLFVENKKIVAGFAVLTVMGVLFVYVRMKGIEQDYALNRLDKEFARHSQKNKELKAMKANYLSVKNLQKMSEKYQFKQPDPGKVIVVPE